MDRPAGQRGSWSPSGPAIASRRILIAALAFCAMLPQFAFAAPDRELLLHPERWQEFPGRTEIRKSQEPVYMGFCADFGGSYRVDLSGAPASFNLRQQLDTEIHAGDQVVLRLAHSYAGNFTGTQIHFAGKCVYDNQKLRIEEPLAKPYEVSWVALRTYVAGTEVSWTATTWPGEATFWFLGAHVVRGAEAGSPPGESDPPAPDLERKLDIALRSMSEGERSAVAGLKLLRMEFVKAANAVLDIESTVPFAKRLRRAREERAELWRRVRSPEVLEARSRLASIYAEGLPPLCGLLWQASIAPRESEVLLIYRAREQTLHFGDRSATLGHYELASRSTDVLQKAGWLLPEEQDAVNNLLTVLRAIGTQSELRPFERSLADLGMLANLSIHRPAENERESPPTWVADVTIDSFPIRLRVLIE